MRKLTSIVAGAAAAAAVLVPVAAAAGKPAATLTADQLGTRVVLTAKLANFAIDAKNVGLANMAGMGHLHFQVDGGKYDYPRYSGPNGQLAAKLGIAGKYSPSVTPSVTYTGLPKGMHTAKVFIVNNDHSNTGSSAKLVFTVK